MIRSKIHRKLIISYRENLRYHKMKMFSLFLPHHIVHKTSIAIKKREVWKNIKKKLDLPYRRSYNFHMKDASWSIEMLNFEYCQSGEFYHIEPACKQSTTNPNISNHYEQLMDTPILKWIMFIVNSPKNNPVKYTLSQSDYRNFFFELLTQKTTGVIAWQTRG